MLLDLVGELPENRHQTPAIAGAHQLVDIELARHFELFEEEIRREWRVDGDFPGPLERHQRVDGLAIEQHAALAVAMQQIEQRLIAGVELQHRRVGMVQHLRHRAMLQDRVVRVEKLLELRAHFARIVGEHLRGAVGKADPVITAHRGVAG